jgi:hypothetical protein
MRQIPALLAGAPVALLLTAGAALAHHSFAAQYDATKSVTLSGTITKVEWTNPHTYFFIDVVDANGKVANWAVEGGAPNVLYREGWRPTSLKHGDKVTISGSPARDGSNLMNGVLFKMPDGRCLFAGTSGPGGTATENCTPGRR